MECEVSLSKTIPMCSWFQSKLNVGQEINIIMLIHRCSEKTQTKHMEIEESSVSNRPVKTLPGGELVLLTAVRTCRGMLLHNFHEIINNIFFLKKH